MSWFKEKVECSHCKTNKSKREFEGNPTCPTCRMNIICFREVKRKCPVDGTELIKAYNDQEVIIDRCPKCEGIWLDAGELDAIRQHHNNNSALLVGTVMRSM